MINPVVYAVNHIPSSSDRCGMIDEESPVPNEILTSAKEQIDQEELSLADNEEILHALSELTPIYENERSYLVLGNYDREPIRRLNLIVDRLNRRQDAYAFRMVGSGTTASRSSAWSPTSSRISSASPRRTPATFSSNRACSSGRSSTFRRVNTKTKSTRLAGCRMASSACSRTKVGFINGELKKPSSTSPRNYLDILPERAVEESSPFRLGRMTTNSSPTNVHDHV